MDAVQQANSGHPGAPMGMADIAEVLWRDFLKHNPANPLWWNRDRFILSNGHASMLLYGLLHLTGYPLGMDEIRQFRQLGSRTAGHPERDLTIGIETTTGPLGQGLANSVGFALAEKLLAAQFNRPELPIVDHYTWVFAGDGCLMEGISHEAASLAGHLGLGRLIYVYDDNHITIDGPTELAYNDIVPERFSAYGWHVLNLGGKANDLDVLEDAMRQAIAETERPTLIVVRSHIAFPSPEMMDTREAHGNPFKPAVITEAKAILGVPDEAFHFDPAIPGQLVESLKTQRDARLAWESRVKAAGEKGVKLLEQLNTNGAATITTPPELFAAGSKAATRKAMQRAMDCFAVQTPGLTAGSADLTDNTGMTLSALSVQSSSNSPSASSTLNWPSSHWIPPLENQEALIPHRIWVLPLASSSAWNSSGTGRTIMPSVQHIRLLAFGLVVTAIEPGPRMRAVLNIARR